MKKNILIIILLSIYTIGFSQTDELTLEAQKIKIAYEKLKQNPNSKELQKTYIEIFPENVEVFKKIFYPATFDQLYMDSHSYIFELGNLSTGFPILVGNKLVKLCVGLKKWDADAIGYVQHTTMEYANSNYSDFVKITHGLNKKDLNDLVTFLADVENHSAYRLYQDFMDKLKNHDETELFAQFKKAKEESISKKDHGF
jgi:hypothetical protein